MKRREFLKTSMLAGAALTLAPVGALVEAAAGTDLCVARGQDAARITRAAVDGLGGMGRFVSRGDIVVVKPNIGWDRTPEYAATTNPAVVAAVATNGLAAPAQAESSSVSRTRSPFTYVWPPRTIAEYCATSPSANASSTTP